MVRQKGEGPEKVRRLLLAKSEGGASSPEKSKGIYPSGRRAATPKPQLNRKGPEEKMP
jgi:hypothetical protein